MLYWAAVFLVISIIAAALGFGGIAGAAAGIAKILFATPSPIATPNPTAKPHATPTYAR
jgi:uncharacterized membrane protein YtjA (UPF0391 family)